MAEEIPPPEKLFLDLPPALRAMCLAQLASNIKSEKRLFDSKFLQPFEERIAELHKTDNAAIRTAEPYKKEADKINSLIRGSVQVAQTFEKCGEIGYAIKYYELCAYAGFPGSEPYERLRTIYTNLNQYNDAIRICNRYIEILDVVRELWPKHPNLKLRPKYMDWIEKLNQMDGG